MLPDEPTLLLGVGRYVALGVSGICPLMKRRRLPAATSKALVYPPTATGTVSGSCVGDMMFTSRLQRRFQGHAGLALKA